MFIDGPKKTFTAGEALAAKRRVKIESGTTTDPPEVVYADAGEDFIGVTEYAVADGALVSVRMNSAPGTFECECTVGSAIARGTTVYGAADGKVSDTSSGTAQGIAMEAASASGDIIEIAFWNVKATTAATVSIADAGGFTSETTVEAALQEVYQDLISVQHVIPVPLGAFTQEDGTALTKFAAGATPGFQQLSDKEVVLAWDGNATPGAAAVVIPFVDPAIDASANVVVHFLAKMAGATDTPVVAMEAYFGAGDTDCAGTDDEVDGGTTLTEYTMTILAADVPTAPSSLTLVLTPTAGQMDTDELHIYALWLEVTRKVRTS